MAQQKTEKDLQGRNPLRSKGIIPPKFIHTQTATKMREKFINISFSFNGNSNEAERLAKSPRDNNGGTYGEQIAGFASKANGKLFKTSICPSFRRSDVCSSHRGTGALSAEKSKKQKKRPAEQSTARHLN